MPLATKPSTFAVIMLKIKHTLCTFLAWLAPTAPNEQPAVAYQALRILAATTLVLITLINDTKVPEIAGDIRWYIMHVSAVLGFGGLCLIQFHQQKRWPSWPLMAWLMLALAAMATFSLIDTYSLPRSIWFYKHLIGYMGLFALIYALRNPAWYRTLMWLIVLPLGFNALLGMVQFLDLKDANIASLPLMFWWQYVGFIDAVKEAFPQAAVPAGAFSNKNLAASWTVMVLPIAFYLFTTTTAPWRKILTGVCLTCALTFLVYSRSRASWLAFMCALIFFGAWVALHRPLRQTLKTYCTKATLIGFGVIFVAVLGLSQFQSPLKGSHAIDRPVSKQLSTFTRMTTSEFGPRIAYNINGTKMTLDHPLNGVGIGAFHTAYPLYAYAWYDTPARGYNLTARPQRAHNDLMQAFTELGLIGGGLYIALFVTALGMGWRVMRHAPAATHMPFAFILTGVVGMSLNALADFPLQMPTGPGTLFALIGLLTGFAVLSNQTALYTPKIPIWTPPRAIWLWLGIGFLVLAPFVVHDSINRRHSAMYLKTSMEYIRNRQHNDQNLDAIFFAYRLYPMNSRVREYYSVSLSNYAGERTIGLNERLKAIQEGLRWDPYAANHLVNFSGRLYKQLELASKAGNIPLVDNLRQQMFANHEILKQVAPYAPHTWAMAGVMELSRKNYQTAIQHFNRALSIDPKFVAAVQGQQLTLAYLQKLKEAKGSTATGSSAK